jgi:hypothetical protein
MQFVSQLKIVSKLNELESQSEEKKSQIISNSQFMSCNLFNKFQKYILKLALKLLSGL